MRNEKKKASPLRWMLRRYVFLLVAVVMITFAAFPMQGMTRVMSVRWSLEQLEEGEELTSAQVRSFTAELTKNFVKALCSEYAVDKYRVYGTGQGVGCEALMVLAAENQKLFTACMFVSGRWNASKLEGLERQRFVFFSAEEDRKVRTFAEKLMDMFSADGYAYAHAVWDGTWTPDQRSAAGLTLTTSTTGHYFVSWKRGTVVPDVDIIKKAASRPAENTMAIHLASFELPYTCVAMMEWLFQQSSKLDVNTTR